MKPLDARTAKAGRILAGWTAKQLAEAAGISIDTLRSFESGRSKTMSRGNEHAVRTALEAAGVQLLEGGQVAAGTGVALRPGEVDRNTP